MAVDRAKTPISASQPLAIAGVVLDEGLDRELDYLIPKGFSNYTAIGSRVLVPLRSTFRKGTIVALRNHSAFPNVKAITQLLSEAPLISQDLLELARWISDYYASPLHRVLRLFLPPTIRKGMKAKQQLFVTPTQSRPKLMELTTTLRGKKEAQARILDCLLEHPHGVLLTELLEQANSSRNALESLELQGVISTSYLEIERNPLALATYVPTKPKSLKKEQQSTLSAITNSLDSSLFAVHLIHGVTGSGKTEIYLQAIAHALKQGKSALFLVPEVALTSQTIERIKGRFPDHAVLFHYRLSDGEKRDSWHALYRGDATIAVGPRSTIFSPLKNLGLIIIDEEHDSSYKQTDESPCYHARDVGIMRAKLSGATVILGSATPSLESYYNALQGKYQLSTVASRAEESSLPKVDIVDMREEATKQQGYAVFSQSLLNEIEKRVKSGEQTLLFLNRRGYNALRLCTSCGKSAQCPHCDIALTYHRKDSRLACHLCAYELSPPPSTCSFCGSTEHLKYQGVGTEQVERTLHAIFPEIRTLRLDADTTKHKGSHEKLFKQFRAGKADVLIGTQMIAKGLHFPSVTLVGVLNADAALNIPDFRSSERVFQLLTQVAGRSGRGALPGIVIIQTWLPEHPIIRLAAEQDYLSFYHEEIEGRKLFTYPPFNRLVKVMANGLKEFDVQKTLEALRSKLLERLPSVYELQPVIPCGHPRIKDRYRFQFLIKGPSCSPVTKILIEEVQKSISSDIRLLIDSDPISTFS
ncbi:MAG: primosomal protein N' [Simkania sp.]|nr:primosomal protein N' [Simkania sp.]